MYFVKRYCKMNRQNTKIKLFNVAYTKKYGKEAVHYDDQYAGSSMACTSGNSANY